MRFFSTDLVRQLPFLLLAGSLGTLGTEAAQAQEPVGQVTTYDVVTTRTIMDYVNGKPAPRSGNFYSETSITVASRDADGQISLVALSRSRVPEVGVVEGMQLYQVNSQGRVVQEFTLGPDFPTADFFRIIVQGGAPTKKNNEAGAISVDFPELNMPAFLNLDQAEDKGGRMVRRIHAPEGKIRSGPYPVEVRAALGELEVDPKGGNLGTSLTVQVAVVAGSPTGKVNFSALETAGRRMGEPRRIPPEDVEKLVAELRSGYRLKSDVDEVAKNPSAEGLSNLEKKVKAHLDAYPKSLLAPQLQLVTSELKRTVQRSEVVAKLKPGQPVTDLEGLALDGEKFRLSDFRGRVVLLDFWATWCPPCVADVPKMLDLFERHKNNLTIIGINADQDKSTLESFVKERGISWRQVWESEPGGLWQTAFAVEGYPTYVLINRDGSLAAIGLRGRNLIDAIDKLVQSE